MAKKRKLNDLLLEHLLNRDQNRLNRLRRYNLLKNKRLDKKRRQHGFVDNSHMGKGMPTVGERNNYTLHSIVTEEGEVRTVSFAMEFSAELSTTIVQKFHSCQTSYQGDKCASSSKTTNLSSTATDNNNCSVPLLTHTNHMRTYFTESQFHGPKVSCFFCKALMWEKESVKTPHATSFPIFSLCCRQGTIRLPDPNPTPAFLERLLTDPNDKFYSHFRKNIRIYNSMFQFTSLGGKIDSSINDGRSPYIFRLNGQTHHRIGSLLPMSGQRPRFAQLYIYDTRNEISNRISVLTTEDSVDHINRTIVEGLIEMLDQINEIVKVFRYARDKMKEYGHTELKMRLLTNRQKENRNYCPPTVAEIAALIVGDIGIGDGDRDVIVEHKEEGLKRISMLHPLYMSMQYPLLFPHGEDGYTVGIPYVNSPVKEQMKRKTLSIREYYAYIIQQRYVEHNTLLKGGRLFQQFLTDAFSAIEETRLHYIKTHQKEIRGEMLKNISDAMRRGDTEGISVGQRIVLPASFTGGPRYMFQNYQDAVGICRYYGFPDLFITFTCNPNWCEIREALLPIKGQRAEDRPDIIARVFKIKVDDLIQDLTTNKHFGISVAVTYTIELKKRGLPHVHILLWLNNNSKIKSASDIDRFVSAELPDPQLDPSGFEVVSNFMIHGPCGGINLQSPCMVNNRCQKFYPKQYQPQTIIDESGYPIYKRRDNKIQCTKNNIQVDNRFVIPHNVDLLIKYNAHINTEVCNQTTAIKYLFKYINKGPDRAGIVIEKSREQQTNSEEQVTVNDNNHNEIKAYVDCRYLSPFESSWRIFEFDIHHRSPAVQRLLIHLPNEQNVYFHDSEKISRIIERTDIEKTMFTEWMVANQKFESARKYLYADFPIDWTWHAKILEWRPRKKGKTIGRIIYINPIAGELYYMRLLLNVVKGYRSYEEIRTIDEVVHSTFQSACEALGLLGNDSEWQEALTLASHSATAEQIRQLFVTIIMFCEVADPRTIFENNWRLMGDDIEYRVRQALHIERYQMPDTDLKNYVLIALQELLAKNNCSLMEKNLPQPTSDFETLSIDRLVLQERNYDLNQLQEDHFRMLGSLNPEQRQVYQIIRNAVENKEGKIIFVHGHGGTGKTYIWKTIISGIRSTGRIVLAVASSGIASLLLPGGQTAHSRFKIPISIDEWSTCQIKKRNSTGKINATNRSYNLG